MATPLDSSVEAEYADGYIHSETELDDVSPFNEGQNVFRDILEKRPEAEHGRLVRFSVFWKNMRYDILWEEVPGNARPIRFRDGSRSMNTSTGEQFFEWVGCRFGYQYNDAEGRNHEVIKEL